MLFIILIITNILHNNKESISIHINLGCNQTEVGETEK